MKYNFLTLLFLIFAHQAIASQPAGEAVASPQDRARELLKNPTPKNVGDAKQLLANVVSQNNAEGIFLLARIYVEHPENEDDKRRGMALLQMAFTLGSLDAGEYLADTWFHGRSTAEPDKDKGLITANQLLQKKPNSIVALTILSEAYLSGGSKYDPKKALEFSERAANLGDVRCMIAAACILDADGKKDEALAWVTKAADLRSQDAQIFAARLLVEGGNGITVDKEKALQYLTSAARAGNDRAMVALVKDGMDKTLPLDPKSIFNWASEAAKQGGGEAAYLMAVCYKDGIGVETDQAERLKWLTRSYEHSNAEAAFELSQIYETGLGADETLSQFYLKLAAEWGSKRARETMTDHILHGK